MQRKVWKLNVFDLLTVGRYGSQVSQLEEICPSVVNITLVASCRFTSLHQCPVFAVVTDDCHANVVLVSHVTINYERCHASFSIRVDDVRSTWSVGIAQLNLATAFIFCKDGILKCPS